MIGVSGKERNMSLSIKSSENAEASNGDIEIEKSKWFQGYGTESEKGYARMRMLV